SHDRRFIDHVATETWVFDGQGGIEDVVGGWRDVLAYYERVRKPAAPEQKSARAAAQKERPKAREKRKGLTFTEEHELASLPAKVEAMEKDLASLDAELADPSLYSDGGAKAADLVRKRQEAQEALDAAYERWEALEEKAGEGK
ncbi:MAG: ABC transporter ATP-binding protein, partial [Succinivibrio sp.]